MVGKTKNRRGRPPGSGKGKADPVDVYVGSRIKAYRRIMRVSQQELADAIGVTFQQVQKYESGHNRVSASRLFDIAAFLEKHISDFFDGIEDHIPARKSKPKSANANKISYESTIENHPETLEMIRLYWRLKDGLRNSVLTLLDTMSKRDTDSLKD